MYMYVIIMHVRIESVATSVQLELIVPSLILVIIWAPTSTLIVT
jgi:hypothetical protein